MAVVEDAGDEPVAVALMTPPWRLLLSWPFPDVAVDLVADDLLACDRQPPGVLGLSQVASRFARAWQERMAKSLGSGRRSGSTSSNG